MIRSSHTLPSYLRKLKSMRITRTSFSWPMALRIFCGTALAAGIFFILAFLLLALMTSLYNGLNFAGYAADGPFQIYNPLRRLAAGQIIGRDFQFFHGIGVPLLHYPTFRLLGGNIFASEFTRWMLGVSLFVGSALLFYYLAFKSWLKSIGASAACLLVFTIMNISVIWPTNSLIGVRTTMPLVFVGFYLLDIKTQLPWRRWRLPAKPLLMGLLAAVAVMFGTEQGIAVSLAYGLAELIRGRKQLRSTLTELVWFVLAAVTSLLSIFTIVTLGHPIAPLKYAFLEVPKDQAWYFGSSPNPFLTRGNLGMMFTQTFLLEVYAMSALLLAITPVLRKMKIISTWTAWASFLVIIYGSVAFIVPGIGGYFDSSEAIPLSRVVLTMLILLAVAVLAAIIAGVRKREATILWSKIAATLVCVALAVFTWVAVSRGVSDLALAKSFHVIKTLKQAVHAVSRNDHYVLSPDWKFRLDYFGATIKDSHSLWSMYAGLFEAQAGMLQPSVDGHDYVIHALGPERRAKYTQQFMTDRPTFVITMRPAYFLYEEWLWHNHWPIYHELLLNYHIVKETDAQFLWQRNDVPKHDPTSGWKFAPAPDPSGSIVLPRDHQGPIAYEVQVKYRTHADLPLTSSLPRYLIGPVNATTKMTIALPPYETSWEFPVAAMADSGPISLKPRVDGLFGGKLDIASVSYREIELGTSARAMFMDSYCYHWKQGGGGYWLNTPECQAYLLPGGLQR